MFKFIEETVSKIIQTWPLLWMCQLTQDKAFLWGWVLHSNFQWGWEGAETTWLDDQIWELFGTPGYSYIIKTFSWSVKTSSELMLYPKNSTLMSPLLHNDCFEVSKLALILDEIPGILWRGIYQCCQYPMIKFPSMSESTLLIRFQKWKSQYGITQYS